MFRRPGHDDDLAAINHRLGLLEVIAHRTQLLEDLNARLVDVDRRLEAAVSDREATTALAANLTQIAEALADRLESWEQRLAAIEARLGDARITSADQR